MGFCVGLGRVLLVVFNIFFLLIGLALFGVGLFLRFGTDVINGYVDSVKTSLTSSASSSGVSTTLDLSQFDIGPILEGIAIALILFGLFILIITFLGCIGACCKIKYMLLAYVIICIVLTIGQIIIIGILFGSPSTFQDPIKKSLREGIQSDYKGLQGTNVVSLSWNVLMQQLKCCGVDSYRDFTGAPNWPIDYTSYSPFVTLKTPISCCKTLPSTSDLSCAGASASSSDNFLDAGCVGTVWDMSIGNTVIVAGALGGIAGFQLALIIFGIIVFCSIVKKKNKTGPMY